MPFTFSWGVTLSANSDHNLTCNFELSVIRQWAMLLCSQSNGSAINDSKGEVICSQTEQLAMLLSTKQFTSICVRVGQWAMQLCSKSKGRVANRIYFWWLIKKFNTTKTHNWTFLTQNTKQPKDNENSSSCIISNPCIIFESSCRGQKDIWANLCLHQWS